MSVIGKNFNGSLYVISDDPTDNDSSHIASIVAVNKLNDILNNLNNKVDNINVYKPGDLYFSLVDEEIDGFILGQGQEISRITYTNLFARYGTKFGEGDGETTFKLPDFRGMTLEGANGNLGNYIEAGLPNINGFLPSIFGWNATSSPTGAFTAEQKGGAGYSAGSDNKWDITFNASRSNSIYGNSNTVQPPAITVNVLIKY